MLGYILTWVSEENVWLDLVDKDDKEIYPNNS